MAMEKESFKKLFDKIVDSKIEGNHFQVRAILYANGEPIEVLEVTSINVVREYIDAAYDTIMMKLTLPNTAVLDKVYPNKRKLEVMIRYEITDSSGNPLETPEFWIRKYRAMLASPIDPETIKVDKEEPEGSDKALSALSMVRLQLVDKIAYEMRRVTCGRIYQDVDMSKLIQAVLSHKLGEVENRKALLNKDFDSVRGVDIVDIDNPNTRTVIIPYDTTIFDLPLYLQMNYGIYSTGIGAYYQTNYTVDDYYQSVKGGFWFVYPLFNFKRYNTAPRKLDVLIVPEKECTDIENTFTYFDRNLSIIATGKSAAVDYSEYNFFDKGNGIVFAKSSELLDDLQVTEGNRVFTDVEKTMRSFKVKERSDGLNDVRAVKENYTENPYVYASKLASSFVKIVTVQWATAMPDLLIPGMPTKLKYLHEDEVVEKEAVLVKVDIANAPIKASYANQTFISHCTLTFAVELREEV